MTLKHRGIIRLGYVRLAVQDLAAARAFATDVVGLIEHRSGTDADGVERAYLRTWREANAFSYVLERGPARLVEIGFQVRDDDDLTSAAQRVEAAGIDVTRADADELLAGLGASIAFPVPAGPVLCLYADQLVTGPAPGFAAPHWNVPPELRGTSAPMNLSHVGFTSANPADVIAFLTGVLDFGMSEVISSDDGEEVLSALLFRTNYGQDLAVFPGEAARLHHVAFLQEDDVYVLRDAAWISQAGGHVDGWGPTRQSYGRTFSLHFAGPGGIRMELFSGGRFSELHAGFQAVRWTESQLDKALSFYDTTDNSQFLTPSL